MWAVCLEKGDVNSGRQNGCKAGAVILAGNGVCCDAEVRQNDEMVRVFNKTC